LVIEKKNGPEFSGPFFTAVTLLANPGVDWVIEEVDHEQSSNKEEQRMNILASTL